MKEQRSQDLKKFMEIARIVFKGIEKKGTQIQQGYASNAIVQIDLLDKTL